ncbi:MAG: hypothetical protein H6541_13135 [Lentimicrobiaceae bacterium]|nr:hypothetical protein [Lentimicrobiaceae bacterium]MCB9024331.1 hypothetical protein [Lentimicrobiaceae bacterium]MCO5264704.1 hypothetical protein [Lentimicrobium sp.]
MKSPSTPKALYEFNKDFNLLINQIEADQMRSPSGYILSLVAMLQETERLKARNLMVMAPAEVFHLNNKIHDWVAQYIIPQMSHLGVKRVAFCVSKLPAELTEHIAVFGNEPEVGVFTSMPRAKAWIMGVSDKPESALLNQARFNNFQNLTPTGTTGD